MSDTDLDVIFLVKIDFSTLLLSEAFCEMYCGIEFDVEYLWKSHLCYSKNFLESKRGYDYLSLVHKICDEQPERDFRSDL